MHRTWIITITAGMLALAAIAAVFSQDEARTGPDGGKGVPGLPRGFRTIELGMELESVKQALLEDPYFDYRGDPDVSFLPRTFQSLIECAGNLYIERAFFQFDEQRLSIIILALDRSRIDHYSLFTTLTEKYGPHSELDPQKVVWRSDDVVLSIERPLTVKYVDRSVFEEKQERGRAEEDLRELSRQRFLEKF